MKPLTLKADIPLAHFNFSAISSTFGDNFDDRVARLLNSHRINQINQKSVASC